MRLIAAAIGVVIIYLLAVAISIWDIAAAVRSSEVWGDIVAIAIATGMTALVLASLWLGIRFRH